MDRELKESCYDVSIRTEMQTIWEYARKQFIPICIKNTQNFVIVSYIHVVIRESRVHIIQLPVIKSATFCNN
jgi:hypothetical protein